MPRIITITSGKGGVGKTSISLNLSLSLASKGFKVCLFDADLGLANVSILTGIYPQKDLGSVISGQFNLNEIIIKDYQGIDIIPGSSGVEQIADLTRTQTGTLIRAFLDLEAYDFFIFDTSAGISSQVLSFCMASHEIILVATCEPTSLTDAYSMLKVLSTYQYDSSVKIVINQVRSGKAAQKAYAQLKGTVNKFLSLKVEPLGIVASDKNVRAAVVSQTPFVMLFPDTIASKCIKSIMAKLLDKSGQSGDIPLEFFWGQCLSFLEKQQKVRNEPAIGAKALTEKGMNGDDRDEKNAFSSLQNKLSLLKKEVDDIKQALEAFNILPKKEDKTVPLPDLEEITLDFESWYKSNDQ